MGSIRVRKSSDNLFFDFQYLGERCREQTVLEDTPANRKKMKTILGRIEAEITLGNFDYAHYFPHSPNASKHKSKQQNISTTPLFKEFALQWVSENEIRWRETHIKSTVGYLEKHIIPVFGNTPVNEVTKSELLAFRAMIAKKPGRGDNETVSAEHINHVMTPLRMILNEAADRFDFQTPYRGIKSLKVPRTEVEPFTLKEVQLMINSIRADYKNYLLVRIFTGMRTSEINGLKWTFIDFDRQQILIREAFVRGKTVPTKNDGSIREISMSDPVLQTIRLQHAVTFGKSEYVFSNGTGKPIHDGNFTRRVWYPLLRYLDLKKRRPYQSRHTAATLWLAAGENPEWIARQMGHTTTEMLFRVYSRYVPNLTRNDGSAFSQLLATHGFGGNQ